MPAQDKLDFATHLLSVCKHSDGLGSRYEELLRHQPMMRDAALAQDLVDQFYKLFRNYLRGPKPGQGPLPDDMIQALEQLLSVSRARSPLSRFIARKELTSYFAIHSRHLGKDHPDLSTRVHDAILESLFDEEISNRRVAASMLKSRSRDELKATLDRLSDPKFDALFSQLDEARSSARMEMVAFLNEISQSFPNAGLPRRELFLFKFMMDSPAHGGNVLGILRRSPSHDPEVLKYVMSIIQSDASSVSEKALALKYFVLLKSNPGFEAARRSEVFAKRLAVLQKRKS